MSERILVAEDDPTLRVLLQTILEDHGFEVQTVGNGDLLVRTAHETMPDLLLIDIMMPVMDGLEAIRQLRHDSRTSHLPMLLITALSSPQQAVVGFDSGADDYITKPFNNDALIARIKANLRRAARPAVNNPLTGLPGNQLINTEVNHRLQQQRPFSLLYVDLNNFKAFNDAYGFARGDRVIRLVASLLCDLKDHRPDDEGFIGHIGGDDYVALVKPDQAASWAQWLIEQFDRQVPGLYDPADRARGYLVGVDRFGTPRRFPLIGISIGIVDTGKREFASYTEVAEVAAEVKSYAKKLPGSQFVFDERQHETVATKEVERRGRSRLVAIVVAAEHLQAEWLGWSAANDCRSLVLPSFPTPEGLLADAPDLVLLDLTLPGAWTWLQETRMVHPSLPIVALAAQASEQARALAAGASACFTVPTAPELVAATMAHLLSLERRA